MQISMKTKKENLSGWRVGIYWFIAVIIIPAFFLASLELGLRFMGVGYSTSFTKKFDQAGQNINVENEQFFWQFFEPAIARPPVHFAFQTVKPKKTFRIFVLGGSAAKGDPDPAYGFSQILEVFLEDQYPEINFEVINAAVVAINSHVVYQITKDLIKHQPDLFLIYLGNNEVVGPFGAGTVFAPLSSNLSLIRAGIFLRSTRFGQTIVKLLNSSNSGEKEKKWRGMEMFLNKQIRHDDPDMTFVYKHFRQNLSDILELAGKEEIKTIVSTVGNNLKNCAPFASSHRQDITESERKLWSSLFQAGNVLVSKKNFTAAIAKFLEAAEIDATYAELQYLLGICYWNIYNYTEAKRRYIMARELDTLRFRADNRINTIIRSVARERSGEGIYLIDAESSFAEYSPYQTPGDELFYEHVHLNFSGNYILANQMFKQVEKILPDWISRSSEKKPLLSEQECAASLAFTDFDQAWILNILFKRYVKPPFVNQYGYEAWLKEKKQEKDFKRKQSSSPAAKKKFINTYRLAIASRKETPWLHYYFARLLASINNIEEEISQLKLTLQYLPQHYRAHRFLGVLLIKQGQFTDGIMHLREALRLNPSFKAAANDLAKALTQKGDREASKK